MSVATRVEKAVKEKARNFANNPEFKKLEDFYRDMIEKGIAKKQEYSLPPLDTLGHLYQTE